MALARLALGESREWGRRCVTCFSRPFGPEALVCLAPCCWVIFQVQSEVVTGCHPASRGGTWFTPKGTQPCRENGSAPRGEGGVDRSGRGPLGLSPSSVADAG